MLVSEFTLSAWSSHCVLGGHCVNQRHNYMCDVSWGNFMTFCNLPCQGSHNLCDCTWKEKLITHRFESGHIICFCGEELSWNHVKCHRRLDRLISPVTAIADLWLHGMNCWNYVSGSRKIEEYPIVCLNHEVLIKVTVLRRLCSGTLQGVEFHSYLTAFTQLLYLRVPVYRLCEAHHFHWRPWSRQHLVTSAV
jgi:hypothetical protein